MDRSDLTLCDLCLEASCSYINAQSLGAYTSRAVILNLSTLRRVLGVAGIGANAKEAQATCYKAVDAIEWQVTCQTSLNSVFLKCRCRRFTELCCVIR